MEVISCLRLVFSDVWNDDPDPVLLHQGAAL